MKPTPPEPVLLNKRSSAVRSPRTATKSGPHSPQRERVSHSNKDPGQLPGEGNGNPLQCSCLENPRDGGTWWAVVYGVAKSRTQLKRLSSSSSSIQPIFKLFQLFSKLLNSFCHFLSSLFLIQHLNFMECIRSL